MSSKNTKTHNEYRINENMLKLCFYLVEYRISLVNTIFLFSEVYMIPFSLLWFYKEIKPASKGNQSWIFIGKTDAETEAPVLWPPDAKSQLIEKAPDAGKDCKQKNRAAENEMVIEHHWLHEHESEQTER